jgi:hypothetical protein
MQIAGRLLTAHARDADKLRWYVITTASGIALLALVAGCAAFTAVRRRLRRTVMTAVVAAVASLAVACAVGFVALYWPWMVDGW